MKILEVKKDCIIVQDDDGKVAVKGLSILKTLQPNKEEPKVEKVKVEVKKKKSKRK